MNMDENNSKPFAFYGESMVVNIVKEFRKSGYEKNFALSDSEGKNFYVFGRPLKSTDFETHTIDPGTFARIQKEEKIYKVLSSGSFADRFSNEKVGTLIMEMDEAFYELFENTGKIGALFHVFHPTEFWMFPPNSDNINKLDEVIKKYEPNTPINSLYDQTVRVI